MKGFRHIQLLLASFLMTALPLHAQTYTFDFSAEEIPNQQTSVELSNGSSFNQGAVTLTITAEDNESSPGTIYQSMVSSGTYLSVNQGSTLTFQTSDANSAITSATVVMNSGATMTFTPDHGILNLASGDEYVWEGEGMEKLYFMTGDATEVLSLSVTVATAVNPPSQEEMVSYIQAAVHTTVTSTDAMLEFNGEGSETLQNVLNAYYPEGYPLDEVPFTFGAVNMSFTGGTAVIRLSVSGGIEIGSTGAYNLRLTSASTLSELVFVPGEGSAESMEAAGCYPSLGSGTGTAGSFSGNQWNGSASDLQIAMPVTAPSFTALHAFYSATLIQAADPIINYDEVAHTLTLSTTTDGASIYYTLDGTEPTTASTLYEGPMVLTENVYLRAIAGGDGFESSAIVDFQNSEFTVEDIAFSYDYQTRLMSLTTSTPYVSIFYTLDGTEPTDTVNAIRYTAPFLINSAGDFQQDLQAFGQRSGFAASNVTVFTREGHITAEPQFSRTDNTVTITCEDAGAIIYYSPDTGDLPTTLYESPVLFTENAPSGNMQAQAVAPEKVPSNIVTYAVDWFKCEDVTFTFIDNKLTMASPSTADGATIYYTLGDVPSDTSSVYTAPITLQQGAVVKAIALRTNWMDSEITVFNLADHQAVAPSITMEGGQISFASASEGTTVAYLLSATQLTLTTYEEILNAYTAAVAAREAQMATNNIDLPEVQGGELTDLSVGINPTYNGYLYAAAKSSSLASSPVVMQTVTGVQAAAPVFNYANLRLAITSASPAAAIYYTIDGSTPTAQSTAYTAPFELTADATVKAIAINASIYDDSEVSTYDFVLADHVTATPEFSFANARLTITSATLGAQIYYNIDAEEDPDTTSTPYTAPLELDGNVTVKAVALAPGYYLSGVNEYEVTEFQCDSVAFAYDNLRLTLSTTTAAATIYYTIDGTVPTNSSTVYSAPLNLTADCTVRAIAVRTGWTTSQVSAYQFVLAEHTVGTPQFARNGTQLTITSATPDAHIYYNVNADADPDNNATLYSAPITLDGNVTVKAIAYKDGMFTSAVNTYIASEFQCDTVTFDYNALKLTLATTTADAAIYYTMDGTVPTTASTAYTAPISLTASCTVKAIAVRSGWTTSDVSTYIFVASDYTVATPEFAFADNKLTITSATPNAEIYYLIDDGLSSTDPQNPDQNSTHYTEPIVLEGNVTVRARAYATDLLPSAVNTYIASEFQCDTVAFAYDTLKLTLTCTTDGAVIYYTLDGTAPTTSSSVYSAPLPMSADCTVKAMAVRQGWTNSLVSSYTFVAADHTVAEPVVTRNGDYLTISSATEGATFYYTTNGATPTTNDTPYTAPFIPTANGKLNILATATGLLPSYTEYTVNWLTTSVVLFSYSYPNLTLTTASTGAKIYYTLDGSEPDTLSTVYTAPLEILQNTTVKAIAKRPGYNQSASTSYDVNIDANTTAAPVIAREGSTVIITSATVGADIYYTEDGTTPTTASTLYTEAITPTRNETIQALAVASGMAQSTVTTFEVDWFKCEPVTFAYENRTVLLSSATAGVTIRYTLDGTEPTAQSPAYTAPLSLTANTAVTAIAMRSGYTDSESTSYNFVLADHTAATPQFNREGNTLTITTTTEGADIYYTTDGSDPTAQSTHYTAPVTLDGNMTVKAIAIRSDLFNSAVATFSSNDFQVAVVEFAYTNLRLSMTTATEGATIYYTTDGTVPTTTSTAYNAPIELTADCVVRAIAVREGWTPSAAATYAFTLAAVTVATPQFSRQGNELLITTTTSGAAIYYTTDGTDPTAQSTAYTNPIQLSGNVTVKAIALKSDMYPSAIGTYVASEFKVADVTFTYANLRLTMSTATPDATIYYTTNGTTPNTTGTGNTRVYSEPIELTADSKVRAIAVRQNWQNSEVTAYDFFLEEVTVVKPQFSRNGNQLFITTTTPGAAIHYTLDGTAPTTESATYTGAIQLDGNGVVLAIAVAEGFYPSALSEYQVNWFKVADVDFSFNNLHLTMSTTTPGATIHYTINGTTPNAQSPVYQQPIELTSDCVVQAVAMRQNWQDSEVSSYEFSLSNVTAESPVISREGNLVTITNITEGTTVYYTLDGSVPTTASQVYSAPIQVTQNYTIRAMATGPNFNPSPVVSYTVDWFQAERVEFAYHELYLEMYTSTANATIYYTTDGSYPSEESQVYTDRIMLTADCDVRAIAVRPGWNTSDVTLYHFNRAAVTAPTPQFYRNGNQLSITAGVQDVQIFYTTDGSEPTEASIAYTEPIQLTENGTIRAIALNEHFYFPSAVSAYTVDWFQVSGVEFALDGLKLTMSTPTPDAAIYYTIDGTIPDQSSAPYMAPLTLTADADFRAIAYRQGWNPSAVSLFHFNRDAHTAPAPQFRRNGNLLSISTGVTDVTVYYTLDGSEPTSSSQIYTEPIQLTRNGVVRAIALGSNYMASAISLYQVDWFRVSGVEFMMEGPELVLHTATPDATIRYTLDGSAPVATSTAYTHPLLLTQDTDVRAAAFLDGWTTSEASIFQFRTATVTAATPNFSRSGDELLITSATQEARIYYTLDGTTPTTASALYEGLIHLTENCVVSAIAMADNALPSGVSTYMVNWFTVEDVTFIYEGGRLAMQTATEGARIYFTIDGSQPSEQSERYTSPITIDHSCVVHAIAVREQMQPSNVSSYYFSLENPSAVTPIFEFADGLLHIFCPTPDAIIHYTMDGSMPTEMSTVYAAPIQLTRNCTVRAIAIAPGFRTSGVAEFVTDRFRVEDIRAELFERFLYLTTETPNATIYFTLDGSTPTTSSPVFDAPIYLEERTTIKAFGVRDGYTTSNMLVVDIDPAEEHCAQPTFILADRLLTISTITDGATLYYSLNGAAPTTPYTGAIELERNGLVRAVAKKTGYGDSEEAQLEIDCFQADLPAYALNAGELTLSCLTPDATIYYTTDGTVPTTSSHAYAHPFLINNSTVVQALAVREGYRDSEVTTFDTALPAQSAVGIDFDGHSFTLTATDGAAIYYTTDGSNPTTLSALYTGQTAADGLCTVRAIAVKEGSNPSNESLLELPAYFDGQTATLRTPGSLSQALAWMNKSQLKTLTVLGRMGEADFATIRTETTALETADLKLVSVTGRELPAGAFAGCSLVTAELPADLQQTGNALFTDCHQLSAIIWNAAMPLTAEALTGVENPNLLLYVPLAAYAPATVSNVIVGRQAASITLSDAATDGNFHSPRPFFAKQVTYTHHYAMQTGIGETRGWETLAVPFNVTRITHATRGEAVPFGVELPEDVQLPRFWLRELQTDGFKVATTIEAHKPYAVSMPNNPEYADRYILAGDVTFEGQNVTIGVTAPETVTDANGLSLISNFRRQAAAADILAINHEVIDGHAEGSIFLPQSRSVLPFEAYVKTPGNAPVKLFEEPADGIEDIPAFMLRQAGNLADGIYDLSGRRVEKAARKGIYIVNGKKVMR